MLKTSLRYFTSVARHGSIRAASSELNVAQSAISRQLQALEYEIGAPLLERRPRGVALTQAGELLYAYCRNAMFVADRLTSELDALQGMRRGCVRLASIESMVPSVLPQAMDRFLSRYPGMTFSVSIMTTDQVVAAIREGDMDVGVCFCPKLTQEIKIEYRMREQLLAVMSPTHPLACSDRVTIQDIAGWPLALSSQKSGARVLFEDACHATNTSITPVLETNSVELLHRFALLGRGITLHLRHTVTESLQKGLLKAHPIVGDVTGGTLDVITLRDRALPLGAETFLLVLREELDALPMPGATVDASTASP